MRSWRLPWRGRVADPVLGHQPQIIDGGQTVDIGAVPVVLAAPLAVLAG